MAQEALAQEALCHIGDIIYPITQLKFDMYGHSAELSGSNRCWRNETNTHKKV